MRMTAIVMMVVVRQAITSRRRNTTVHTKCLSMAVAETKQTSCDDEEGHEDKVSSLRHVAAESRD